MSRERALARAEREAAAAKRAASDQGRRQRESVERARRDLRALRWRRLRLWQSASGRQSAPGRRRTEGRAVLATLSLVLFVVVYVLTGSIRAVLGMALILLVAGPVLVKLTSDRSRK